MTAGAGKASFRVDLRAVVYPHQDGWIAHCLELDLVAEGTSAAEALRDVMDLAAIQVDAAIDAGDLESIFRPAPPEVWAMFSRAGDTAAAPRRRPKSVARFEARELVLA
jgi:hypothetical protein